MAMIRKSREVVAEMKKGILRKQGTGALSPMAMPENTLSLR